MRHFHLNRTADASGISGVGIVAEGVQFSDGRVALRWKGERASTAAWDSIKDVEAVHGHNGQTEIEWGPKPIVTAVDKTLLKRAWDAAQSANATNLTFADAQSENATNLTFAEWYATFIERGQ